MNAAPITYSTILKLALALFLVGAASAFSFGMWMERGAALFLSFAQAGLSWCL